MLSLLNRTLSGKMSGRERYLQIESARVGIDIYNFARKIQTVYELRLHRFRVYLRGLYAAGGTTASSIGRKSVTVTVKCLSR